MIPHLFLHYYFLFFEKVEDEYCNIEEEEIFFEDKIVENLGEIWVEVKKEEINLGLKVEVEDKVVKEFCTRFEFLK